MSRKRSHTKAFTLSDNSENEIYLLPGCYYNPQLECATCEECCSDPEMCIMEEDPYLDELPGDEMYVADAYGNVYYKSHVSYLLSEKIICCSEARMEGDDLSDPDSECDNKKTRANSSSDEEETSNSAPKQLPGYIVEEPPDEEDMKESK